MRLNSKLYEILQMCENLGLELGEINAKERFVRLTNINRRYTFRDIEWRYNNIEKSTLDEKPLQVHSKYRQYYITRKRLLEYNVSKDFIFLAQSLYSKGEAELHTDNGRVLLKSSLKDLGFENIENTSYGHAITIFKNVLVNMKYNKDIFNDEFDDIEKVIQYSESRTINTLETSTPKAKLIGFVEKLVPDLKEDWNTYTKSKLFSIFLEYRDKIIHDRGYCIM